MKKNAKPTLLDQVQSCRLWGCGAWGPAQAVRLASLFKASNFERAQIAAMSIKEQRVLLAKARAYLKKGKPDAAQLYIASYYAERRAYNNLFSFGSK